MGHADDAAPQRLTILLNAASFSTHRTVIRERDRERIADALTALLEHLPTTSVRVVVFSLEQQKEMFRADAFHPDDVTKVADAIAATPQTTVDVGVLKNPFGYVDFLAGVIRRELDAPDPADTVIFLGPTSRYFEKGAAGGGTIARALLLCALRRFPVAFRWRNAEPRPAPPEAGAGN
jgi:hypothetical protein